LQITTNPVDPESGRRFPISFLLIMKR
jgi:hypothetical protein